jgi:hypothetical protein
MPNIDVPLNRIRFGQTTRKDPWWQYPLFWGIAFIVGFGYLGWGIIQPNNYWHPPYLTPLASPLVFGEGPHAWFGPGPPSWWPAAITFFPGFFIMLFPGVFRVTCYYYRGSYYKALLADPINCAVGEPRHKYRGENSFPLILQNVHRFFLPFAIGLILFLTYDAILAFRFPVAAGSDETRFGIGLGSILMVVNVVFVSAYTFGCHSFRHLVGGIVDVFSRAPLRKKLWDCSTCLNTRHGTWAMASLYSMCATDLYIRLCAAGVISDLRVVF